MEDYEQYVISPEDARLWNAERLQAFEEELDLVEIPKRQATRLWIGSWVHPLIHTYVKHRQYDPATDRFLYMGKVCAFCERAKR